MFLNSNPASLTGSHDHQYLRKRIQYHHCDFAIIIPNWQAVAVLGALLGPAMTLFQKLTAAGELEKQLKQVRTARATSFLVKNGKNARSIDRKTDDAAL